MCVPNYCDELVNSQALAALENEVTRIEASVAAAGAAIDSVANQDLRIDFAAVAMLQEAGWSVTILDCDLDEPVLAVVTPPQLSWAAPANAQLPQAYALVNEIVDTQQASHSVDEIAPGVLSEMVGTPVGHQFVLLGSRVCAIEPNPQ